MNSFNIFIDFISRLIATTINFMSSVMILPNVSLFHLTIFFAIIGPVVTMLLHKSPKE